MGLSSGCSVPVIMIKAEIGAKYLNELKITGFFSTQQSAKSKSYKNSQTSFFPLFGKLFVSGRKKMRYLGMVWDKGI